MDTRLLEAEVVRTEFRDNAADFIDDAVNVGTVVRGVNASNTLNVTNNGDGTVSIELPQPLSASSSPTFANLTISVNLGVATINGQALGAMAFEGIAAASADTATPPGAAYSQAEVQAILAELRDLKAKLRAAGHLDT